MTSLFLHSAAADRRVTFASLVAAFALASAFYRFGNFALECVAFLVTWVAIDFPVQWLVRAAGRPDPVDRPPG